MLALVCAGLTFSIVFWAVWELGQPWRKYGLASKPLFTVPGFNAPTNYVVSAIEGKGDELHITYRYRADHA